MRVNFEFGADNIGCKGKASGNVLQKVQSVSPTAEIVVHRLGSKRAIAAAVFSRLRSLLATLRIYLTCEFPGSSYA